jgi:hypothetical protein
VTFADIRANDAGFPRDIGRMQAEFPTSANLGRFFDVRRLTPMSVDVGDKNHGIPPRLSADFALNDDFLE